MVVYRFDAAAQVWVPSSEVRVCKGTQTITDTHADANIDVHTLSLCLSRGVSVYTRT